MSEHKRISLIKSTVRIVGYVVLGAAFVNPKIMFPAILLLVLSEIIGVIEEWGEK